MGSIDSSHEEPTTPDKKATRLAPLENKTPSTRTSRVKREENSRRSNPLNPLLPIMLLLLGVLLGILATLFFILFLAHDRTPVKTTTISQTSTLTVQVSSAYLTHLVSNSFKSSGMPGEISNVQVTLANDSTISVKGEDKFSALFLNSTQPFAITLQIYTQACQPKVKILHADLGSIPITNFVQGYESEINQEIEQKPADLPPGFVYCAASVRTQSDALFIVYTATPV